VVTAKSLSYRKPLNALQLRLRRLVRSDGDSSADRPAAGSGRTISELRPQHRPGAALARDSSLEDPELERGVRAAAALAQENERLDAELRARVKEVRASRARIVEAGLAERRRLERDLHDGAQQRLVSLVLGLRMIEKRLDEDPAGARRLLEMAGSELEAALRELRDVARGTHPAALSERGLDAALETLASRTPLPVELEATIAERLPEPVELTLYFVVSEALTNVAKHAHASQANVRAGRHNGRVVVEVSDDGVGGADPARGSGLSGLADRLSALDGKLEVRSERGQGTVLRAEIPY
jgi:signal transduction histidine kinase